MTRLLSLPGVSPLRLHAVVSALDGARDLAAAAGHDDCGDLIIVATDRGVYVAEVDPRVPADLPHGWVPWDAVCVAIGVVSAGFVGTAGAYDSHMLPMRIDTRHVTAIARGKDGHASLQEFYRVAIERGARIGIAGDEEGSSADRFAGA